MPAVITALHVVLTIIVQAVEAVTTCLRILAILVTHTALHVLQLVAQIVNKVTTCIQEGVIYVLLIV